MSKISHGRKDANQDDLDLAAQLLGATIIKCSSYAQLGFDRIYGWKGETYITEIKNPSIKDPEGALTETEEKRKKDLERNECAYLIAQTPEELLRMIGAEGWEIDMVLKQMECAKAKIEKVILDKELLAKI